VYGYTLHTSIIIIVILSAKVLEKSFVKMEILREFRDIK